MNASADADSDPASDPAPDSDASPQHAPAPVTIAPDTNTLTLNPGDTFDETITVTVPKNPGSNGIDQLKLVPSASIAPLVASVTPAGGYGPLPGDMEHVLKFAVRFHGVACKDSDQVFTGTLDVVADGRVVAAKKVTITIPACRSETMRYSVKFVCGTQPEACGCSPVRPGRYATQISIHNYGQEAVTVRKRFIPVVLAGAPVAREPRFGTSRAEDGIDLPPHTATMDDCCRIGELLFGAPVDALTIGLLEIVATHDVAVTAIYTTCTGLDVVQVDGRPG
ncbi:hypothetical protein GJV26_21595 [Massilia dura]|uniref:Uncharacterized protein n=1 Tax=Pseudoduganella dura TaxID=321982 RepID=A0A6I3XF24_9BURK|nr:hypothetical protein [Pseudoduganella dura]MUI15039.1 hypothetical protein [Pseudoduganella dura]